MKTFKQMYYESGHTAVAKTNTAQKRDLTNTNRRLL